MVGLRIRTRGAACESATRDQCGVTYVALFSSVDRADLTSWCQGWGGVALDAPPPRRVAALQSRALTRPRARACCRGSGSKEGDHRFFMASWADGGGRAWVASARGTFIALELSLPPSQTKGRRKISGRPAPRRLPGGGRSGAECREMVASFVLKAGRVRSRAAGRRARARRTTPRDGGAGFSPRRPRARWQFFFSVAAFLCRRAPAPDKT